ncbi:hypothetical protein R7V41_00270 [Mesomycoplasma ovipneumoniae]|uniref:Uncharacterized protein n=1 Tax=Mesomycoplasma ovipneumoniae TaxID=29562 RepID=A0AAJ2UEC2_9BACT|nr:hypothetical protein [Mesomycoplasma ovipneumoniae]MDW2906077.1 hypothetical protein [Mesomycoplasma ovipneumoniae]MDW2913962.1 hypothetical protein [Mesomycoplasma ovipneumoniae]
MKAITLLFKYLFLNWVVKLFFFLIVFLETFFLTLTTGYDDFLINYPTSRGEIIIWGLISALFILFLYYLIRYVWFIKKYKKEALNLTNSQFEEKYEKWSLEPRWWIIIRDMWNYPDEIEFKKEKKIFLFHVHYRIFILQIIYIFISFISFISLPILTIIIAVLPIKTDYFSIHFAIFGLGFIIIVISQLFLHKISTLLIKNTIEAVYNKYKNSIARFFMPKVNIKP